MNRRYTVVNTDGIAVSSKKRIQRIVYLFYHKVLPSQLTLCANKNSVFVVGMLHRVITVSFSHSSMLAFLRQLMQSMKCAFTAGVLYL